MDKKTIGNWIMYHEVQRLVRERIKLCCYRQSISNGSTDQRTVKRYSLMSEAEYALFLEGKEIREKLLAPW